MAEVNESDRPHLSVTPWGAFAGAAAIVSALGLAFTLGRYVPLKPSSPGKSTSAFESVYNQPPIKFERLQVDRGDAQ